MQLIRIDLMIWEGEQQTPPLETQLHDTLLSPSTPLTSSTSNSQNVRITAADSGVGAARYVQIPAHPRDRSRKLTATPTANPVTALQPLRTANAAFISSSSNKKADPHAGPTTAVRAVGPSNVKGNPGAPPPMKKVTEGMEVPLASQEGNKGVVQYAL